LPGAARRATLCRLSQSPALFPTLRSQFEHWLFDLPEAARRPRTALGDCCPLRYLYALLRDLAAASSGLRAMSLVYSTLFAIVPVIAVAFAGSRFELQPRARAGAVRYPAAARDQGYSLTRASGVSSRNVQGTILGTLASAFLIYTAVVSMIQKIEASLISCGTSSRAQVSRGA